MEEYKKMLRNYAVFSGRSTRRDYWMAVLFNFVISLAVGVVAGVIRLGFLSTLYAIAMIIPGLALNIRRLHDTGKAWYYIFMGLIPLAGFIILIVQYCKESDADNQWGPAPRN